jgi:hypothetical protein
MIFEELLPPRERPLIAVRGRFFVGGMSVGPCSIVLVQCLADIL